LTYIIIYIIKRVTMSCKQIQCYVYDNKLTEYGRLYLPKATLCCNKINSIISFHAQHCARTTTPRMYTCTNLRVLHRWI